MQSSKRLTFTTDIKKYSHGPTIVTINERGKMMQYHYATQKGFPATTNPVDGVTIGINVLALTKWLPKLQRCTMQHL